MMSQPPDPDTPPDATRPADRPSCQPHGWVLVLDPERLRVVQASHNMEELTGRPAREAIGKSVKDLLGSRADEALQRAMGQADNDTVGPVDAFVTAELRRFDVWLHGHWGAGGLVLEIEPATPAPDAARFLASVGNAIRRYRAAPDVAALTRAAAADLRRLTGYDRAVVVRMGGTAAAVVATDANPHRPVRGGDAVALDLIAADNRHLLELNRLRLIADSMADAVPLVPDTNPVSGCPADLGRAVLRMPEADLILLARAAGIRSVLTISLMTGGHLWGLVWCDSLLPRRPPPAVRALCEAIGEIIAAQIAAIEDRALAAARVAATRVMGRIAAGLRGADNIVAACRGLAGELLSLFEADGLLVMVDGSASASGFSPPANRWLALLETGEGARQDGVTHAVGLHATDPHDANGVGAVLRIDITAGGQLVLLRSRAGPWTLPQQEAAAELHRLLVERHAEIYRARAEVQLHRMAFYDPVTELPNRAFLMQELQRVMAVGQNAALLVITLDRFKALKSTLGEAGSDALMAAVARRLQECLGPGDQLARIDTGEYAVLMSAGNGGDAATMLFHTVREALKTPIALDGRDLFVTVSFGLVESAAAHGSADEVVRNAEIAAYEAEAGGGGSRAFEAEMRARLTERYALYDKLRHAIYFGNAIQTHYQPIVDLASGDLLGFEALARWQDPERGFIPPVDFIPLAEETGLIVPLGNQVLVQACRNIARWNRGRQGRPLYVSVNLSPYQMDSSRLDLPRWVKGVLQLTGADPSHLVLEITESGLIAKAGQGLTLLQNLRDLGVTLAIDDFGTGYSSLSYLQRLPVNMIKVDRSFVAGMDTAPKGTEMVKTIVQLAQVMGFSVVAEGIETDQQADRLRDLGCAKGQGYHYAKPLPPDQAAAMAAGSLPWRAAAE